MLAKRYNLEIWTVDVVRTETAKRSDRFFHIRPDTDVLLALGVAKVLIGETSTMRPLSLPTTSF